MSVSSGCCRSIGRIDSSTNRHSRSDPWSDVEVVVAIRVATGDSPTFVLKVVKTILVSVLRCTVDRKLSSDLQQDGFLRKSHFAQIVTQSVPLAFIQRIIQGETSADLVGRDVVV